MIGISCSVAIFTKYVSILHVESRSRLVDLANVGVGQRYLTGCQES